jgi:phytoene synthase
MADASPFLDEVRTHDRTAFLAALFAPEAARPALLALAAYRIELRRIVERAREPLAAEIRLQWWRDALSGAGEGGGVPLVIALREAMARWHWPAETLTAMSEAHIHDLYADPFETWDAFDGHAGEAYGAPLQLGAMAVAGAALGPEPGLAAARTAATAAGWAGVALAAADTVATFADRFARGRTHVPASAWREATGSDLAAALSAGAPGERAADAVRAVVAHGRRADDAFRAALPAVAAPARPALLPGFTARAVLDAADRAPLGPRLPSPFAVQWRLWRAARRLRRL